MADITMCRGEQCHLKEFCHRYTANVNALSQSYLIESPVINKYNCEYFYSMKYSIRTRTELLSLYNSLKEAIKDGWKRIEKSNVYSKEISSK